VVGAYSDVVLVAAPVAAAIYLLLGHLRKRKNKG
jgi:hypothetical protein